MDVGDYSVVHARKKVFIMNILNPKATIRMSEIGSQNYNFLV